MFGWIRKKGSERIDSGKEGIKKAVAYDEVKKHWSDIHVMYDTVANPKKIKKDGTRKTFAQTIIDNKLTQLEINQIYFNYAIGFYVSFVFALVCIGSALYSAIVNHSFVGFMVGMGIFAICGANMFRFSFDCFKIKHQKFCSPQDWWNNANQWFPAIKK